MSSDALDNKNFAEAVKMIVMVVVIICLLVGVVEVAEDDVEIEKEKTEQVRIQACADIENEGVRALCVNAKGVSS